jgi:hypothetical protein
VSQANHAKEQLFFIFGSLAVVATRFACDGKPIALRPRLSTGLPLSDVF